jgi:hypothetical protein
VLIANVMVFKTKTVLQAGHVTRMEEINSTYKILVGKPQGRKPFAKHRSRQKDNIKTNLKETVCEVADWIPLSQGSNHSHNILCQPILMIHSKAFNHNTNIGSMLDLRLKTFLIKTHNSD